MYRNHGEESVFRMLKPKVVAGALIAALSIYSITACSNGESNDEANGTTHNRETASGEGHTHYPLELPSPFGTTTLEKKPERVAVLTMVDFDIAAALGVTPVISKEMPADKAVAELGNPTLETFDDIDNGIEKIATTKPDVVLATSMWSLDKNYEKLSHIAPIVAFEGEKVEDMTWQDRTLAAGRALDLEDKAQEAIDNVAKKYSDAKDAHPEFSGKTYAAARDCSRVV